MHILQHPKWEEGPCPPAVLPAPTGPWAREGNPGADRSPPTSSCPASRGRAELGKSLWRGGE